MTASYHALSRLLLNVSITLSFCTLRDEAGNMIVLSDEFYQEITLHPIPTDIEAVKVLAAAPAALDLYVWLSYRCFTAKGEESVPIFGPFGLIRQIGSVEYSCPRRFKAKLAQWLRTIHLIWPECPARISPDGRYLVVDRGLSVNRAPALCPPFP